MRGGTGPVLCAFHAPTQEVGEDRGWNVPSELECGGGLCGGGSDAHSSKSSGDSEWFKMSPSMPSRKGPLARRVSAVDLEKVPSHQLRDLRWKIEWVLAE